MLQVCVRQEELLDSEKENSNSVCLSFEGEWLESAYLDYVCHRVKSYERAPLRCFCCQQYGRIKTVLDAARRYLNIVDISGEDLDVTLQEGFASTQPIRSGL